MFKPLIQLLIVLFTCLSLVRTGRKKLFVELPNFKLQLLHCSITLNSIACAHLCAVTKGCVDIKTALNTGSLVQCCMFQDESSPFGAGVCTGLIVAIGMESGAILNEQITSSTALHLPPIAPHYAYKGRLNLRSIWCSLQYPVDPNPFIEIDMGNVKTVVAVSSQGNPAFPMWVKFYSLLYKQNDHRWHAYRDIEKSTPKIFQANEDRNSVVLNILPVPIHARHIKFEVITFKRGVLNSACMRVEVYTFKDDCN